jgi:hypothetical protein
MFFVGIPVKHLVRYFKESSGANLFHRTGRLVLLRRGGPQNTTIQNRLAASVDDDVT